MTGEKIYFNKGQRRKSQIYDWFVESAQNSVVLNEKLNRSKVLLSVGDVEGSTTEFKNLVEVMGDTTTVGYVIEENYGFGKDRVILDLYSGIFTKTLRKIKRGKPRKISRVDTREVKEIEKELKEEKRKFIIGIDRTGKRRKARFERVVVNKIPQTRIRDIKTGRFLKQTKKFRREHRSDKNV